VLYAEASICNHVVTQEYKNHKIADPDVIFDIRYAANAADGEGEPRKEDNSAIF
jgi:hypothetical protein